MARVDFKANARGTGGIVTALSLLLIGVALAVVIIIDQQLWEYVGGYVGNYYYYYGGAYVVVEDNCYLGPPSNGTNFCYVNWCLAAIGGFCALFAFFAAVCSRGGRSPGPLCALPFAAVLFLAAAITNSVVVPQANDQYAAAPADAAAAAGGTVSEQEIPQLTSWRNAILGLTWAGFVVAAAATLAAAKGFKDASAGAAGAQAQFVAGAQPYYPQGAPPPGAYYPQGAPPPGAYYPQGAPPPGAYYPPPPGGFQGAPASAYYPQQAPAGGAPPPVYV